MANSFRGKLKGGKYKQKLYFVPCADNEPKVGHEISEPAIFRFLLNEEKMGKFDEDEVEIPDMLNVLKDIDKQLKITQVEIHQSSMGATTDLIKAFHAFIVFKSTSEKDKGYWWSLEKNSKYIVLRRSRNKENVKEKFKGEKRTRVKLIKEDLKGKGTIQDLFEILWAQQLIPEKYHIKKSNCQSLVSFVSQQITEIGYEFKGYFPYSPPPESGRDKKMLDLINILRGCSDWPPLFTLIPMGSTDLVDKMIKSGNYDINACNNEHKLTPLHFAILLDKTKMVQHLLKPPLNADPTKRDASGRSALQLAATYTKKTEIFDLLLAHPKVKVDDVDGKGRTALHYAALISNVIAVQKLLDKGANPNIGDIEGLTPLHVVAPQRDGNPIIDLLLEAKKVKGMGNVNDINENGMTALHYAAKASNEITAEHLINKGANVNHRDNYGLTPIDMAALGAEDMKIIDLLLENINEGDIQQYRNDKRIFLCARHNFYGLVDTILDRLAEKGIQPPSTETDEFLKASREVDKVIDNVLKDGNSDINGHHGHTYLSLAIATNNVNGVRRLLERGADPTIRNNKGHTPLHQAVDKAKDFEILNLLLANEKVDINETTSIQGWTALHIAIIHPNVIAVDFLLSNGANPNVTDKDGDTPLHLAAMFAKNMDIVELLLNHPDVNVNYLNNDGHTALYYAKENKKRNGERIVNLLKEKGAVETENTKKHNIRFFINRISDKILNILRDNTIAIGDKISRISERNESLFSAINNSNVETVRLLLKNGADISSARGEDGMNALHMASFHAKTTDVIDAILETGKFDINGVDNNGWTPLHHAISGTNREINASYLLKRGADPTIRDHTGITPFHLAAQLLTDTDVLGLMLENEKQIDIDEKNNDGLTALHMAMMYSNVNVARFLLSNGANPNVADKYGRTPLHLAAHCAKEMEIVELLLNHQDTNVNHLDNIGFCALWAAMLNKHGLGEAITHLLREKMATKAEGSSPETKSIISKLLELFIKNNRYDYLLEDGQDIDAITKGENGANALHVAAANEKTTDLIDAILETEKFDINGVDNNGWTPLHHAISGTNREINARHLLEKGADPTIADTNGITPFHCAAMFLTDTHVLGLMLANENKMYIDAKNNDGKTALHVAIDKSNVNAVRLLLLNGAKPNIADKEGHTPLHVAVCCAKDMDIVKLLLNHPDVDVNCLDKWGINALHWTKINRHGLDEAIGNLLRKKMASVMKFRDLDLD